MNPASPASPALSRRINLVFGLPTDPMPVVERRAEQVLRGLGAVVWAVDASTFRFHYVGRSAASSFGYPPERWLTTPTFWEEQMLHPEDARDVIATLALGIARGEHQEFSFRAVAADGSVLPCYAVTRAVIGSRGLVAEIRGILIPEGEHRRGGLGRRVLNRLSALAGRVGPQTAPSEV